MPARRSPARPCSAGEPARVVHYLRAPGSPRIPHEGFLMPRPRVLITGASGLIGRLTIAALQDRYEFSGVSRRPVPEVPCLQADIADAAAIKPAFQGIDMVLHLAAYTGEDNWPDTMAV